MEFERPHRSGTTSKELFICFTSRPSFSLSSSMKISSKVPILSPGRSDKYREQQPTLSFSSSLNRRLGSMKGEHSSPMFKKRGCSGGGGGYENAEPSSPKVTCIGQVRVKTKKQGKKMMSLGKREGGECRNQKWVHLPLTICEALRGFGAEFSCFLPCGGNGKPCSSNGRGVKRRSMSSCGAAFARWLMALQEGEEEKRREVRVMQVGEEEKNGESNGGEKKSVEIEEERFSICIPPKNALLLMRCRSEPLRMSALANRFWDSPIEDEDEDSTEEEESEGEDTKLEVECREPENRRKEPWGLAETVEDDHQSLVEEEKPLLNLWVSAQVVEEEEQWGLAELFEEEEENPPFEEEEQWGLAELFEEEEENPLLEVEETITSDSTLEEQGVLIEENETHKEETKQAEIESEEKQDKESTSSTNAVLPDCLLMMMCEPKLSMEVSKETWVCSTDFIKRPSQNQSIKINNGSEVSTNKDVRNADPGQLVKINNGNEVSSNKDIRNADSGQQQNPQSTGMVNMIEQKLMSAVAYEPFVLTRCKSEPLRSSGKLVPESCFWKNARLEPPPGVGF